MLVTVMCFLLCHMKANQEKHGAHMSNYVIIHNLPQAACDVQCGYIVVFRDLIVKSGPHGELVFIAVSLCYHN
jgi:hypothetical protein